MSISRRENILARLFAILDGLPDGTLNTVVRNRGLLNNDSRPAAALLDGDENIRVSGDRRGRQRMSPSMMTMKPEIFILMKSKRPQNETIGQELNELRGTILRAIADDADLLALVGPNGDISYDGCQTDLKSGMMMDGQMQLFLSITTAFDPYKN